MQQFLTYLLVLLAFSPPSAFGAGQITELSVVEVTDDEVARPVQSGALRVFTRADFALRYQSLGDFLNTVNGVQIQHSGALGDPVLASIQGGDSRQTIITINGVILNSSQYGSYDLNQVTLNQIERIEIHNNSLSTDLPGAATATINIITKNKENSTNIGAAIGSYGYYKADINIATTSNISLQLSDLRSQNNFKYPVTSPAFAPSDKGREERLKNAEYQKQQFRITYSQNNISASLFANHEDKKIPDYFRNNPTNNAYLKTNQYRANVSGNFRFRNLDNEWQVFRQQQKDRYRDAAGVIGLGEDDDQYDTVKSQLQWNLNHRSKYWQLAATSQWYEETYTSRYLNDEDSKLCLTPEGNCDQAAFQTSWRNAVAVGLNDEQQRHELSFKTELFSFDNINRQRSGHNNSNKEENKITGQLLRYSWTPGWAELHLSYKKAPRIPSLFELFGDRGLLLSNPSLKPEIARTKSLDTLIRAADNTVISLTVFSRQLDNAIVAVYDARGVGRYENTSEARISGYDAQLRQEYGFFYGQIDYSRYHSNTKSNTVFSLDDKELAGIYQRSSQLSLGFANSTHHLAVRYKGNGKLFIDRSNLIEGDDVAIWSLEYQFIRKRYQSGLQIKNLTDKKYRDFTNRPAQRRQVIAYFNLKF